ncbi:hypothetical protein, partial [Escherichia coli]|uniref:hypothetical protein n=1 Tax=Escherichia coli TaxID=562 RepID=UPI000A4154F1
GGDELVDNHLCTVGEVTELCFPDGQGAWYCSQHHFREVIPFGASLRYAGRPASASPAVGYMSVHQKQQQDLVNDALNVE